MLVFICLDKFDYDVLHTQLVGKFPDLVEIKAMYVDETVMEELGGPALKVASFDDPSTVAEGFINFVVKCPNIVSISITGGDNDIASDKAVHAIVTNCPRLEHLTFMSLFGSLTDLSLSHLESLQYIKELGLDWNLAMTRAATQAFFQLRGPNLEVLSMQFDDKECTFIDEILVAISYHCPRLRVFHCESESPHITKVAVAAMVRGCPLLEDISISVGTRKWDCLDDEVMVALAENRPRLKTVTLSEHRSSPKFTDIGLIALSRGCPDLTQLYIHGAHSITDAAVLSLAEHCHKLKSIYTSENDLITSSAVCSLLEANPDITSLQLHGRSIITDEVCRSLMRGCRQLTTLTFGGCENLSEALLVALLSRCPSLGYLSFFNFFINNLLRLITTQETS